MNTSDVKTQYQVVNDTYYHADTDKECVRILEHCRKEKIRVVLTCVYGQADETQEAGRIGRTTGPKAAAILVYNKRAMGGFMISTQCIVKIQRSAGKQVLYSKK